MPHEYEKRRRDFSRPCWDVCARGKPSMRLRISSGDESSTGCVKRHQASSHTSICWSPPQYRSYRCPIADARDDEESVALYARNTRPFNTYGLPAVSVPCGFASNGFPIGLQIVGPPWGEESVLRVAHAYEQATDWKSRHPSL